jgi:microcin C transport system substrate-binding protein
MRVRGQALKIGRREFLALAAGAAAAPLLPGRPFAASPTDTPLHGLSAFGDLKYPPHFTHFDYLNPDAPKGGTINFSPPNWLYNQNVTTFNTLNSFVLTGDAPPRMELCHDALMASALDEPDALYGLLAETVTISADRNSFTFKLRPEARWHDGSPLTAEDVAFTYTILKDKGHPQLSLPLAEMTGAEAVDPATVRLAFSGNQSSSTILTVAAYPVISKAWFTDHPFDSSQLVAPLGSGPYRIQRVSAGQTIVYERVEEYWARDLPVNRGLNNFDTIRIDVYRDRQAGLGDRLRLPGAQRRQGGQA